MSEGNRPYRALGDSLAAGRERAFVGRQTEIALFRAALAGDPAASPVHYLHGPGGIGKSMLLRRLAQEARTAGRPVVEVDGRIISPTPEGFAEAAKVAVQDPGAVLLVDTFERCQGLEGWLWDRFLPKLPEGNLVVIAGRLPPDPVQTSDPGWADLLKVTALRNLVPRDAAEFLRVRGVPRQTHAALLSFTGGNPLALALAAAVTLKDATASPEWTPSHDVIATLLPQLIGNIPDQQRRNALEVCAHAYITTESLLQAMLGDDAPQLFAWLRHQPFVEATATGLFPHDAVRELLEADLRWRNPEGFSAMHHAMREHLLGRLRSAPETEMLQATGSLIYLFRTDRAMSDFNGWREAGLVEDQPYTPQDRTRVLELVREAEGEESEHIASYWLDRQPEAFRIYRSTQTGVLDAFSAWLRLSEDIASDPIASAAWRHACSVAPPRPGEHIGIERFSVSSQAYQRPSAPMTLMQWRATGEMIRGERLACSYVVMRDDGFWNAHLGDINMVPAESRPVVGDHSYAMFFHDWRAQPVSPWLLEKSNAMLTGTPMVQTPLERSAELTVLSRPEFEAAVRDALRSLRRPELLASNPLNRSRLIAESTRPLADVLKLAADALLEERGGDKRHRAVMVTYFKGSPTQEAAAERLGIPFSTYRRHLTAAVDRMCQLLWQHELNGTEITPPENSD
ncbi:ATP-binding protein [Streptomyces sp. NBC_00568]|uniref:ATP-binding protein n=1 Tax=Streptomyces sp. NBC_00568 TaxID=2975779 RepID=UPI0022529AFD|nr:ATP-binding protein [Streptomyces sp. NBC_00568]MCX4993516.1 ATP-binding protein [Streptomyces sp. NBC_00568]